jgi:hypothetical protein
MPLTRDKLQGPAGYAKFRSQDRAMRIARKLDLSATHSHEMNGMTIHMPGGNHRDLNDELRKRGFEETMVPGQGGGGMGMMGGGMMGGMMGSGGMMSGSNGGVNTGETGMLLPDGDELRRMNEQADQTDESLPSFMGDSRRGADGEFFSDGMLTGDDASTTAEAEPDLIRDEDVREPFDSMFGSGDPDDDDEMELY